MSRCAVAVAGALLAAGMTACGSTSHGSGSSAIAREQALAPSASAAARPSLPRVSSTTHLPATRKTSAAKTAAPAPAVRTTTPAPPVATRLPLSYPTGNSTEVITATAPASNSTTGTLQAWQLVSGAWRPVGPATTAWFGSQGLTSHMSESLSATPVGSFTLTQAFGSQPNPATGLPYFQTTPADWWISKTTAPDDKLYNTHQRCSSSCPFDTSNSSANTNEHLYYEQPFYRYAVVIDYNTPNAPGGVVPQAGSAIFLHVTNGSPTAGCVAIDESRLVSIMRWLTPSAHPRILIGVA